MSKKILLKKGKAISIRRRHPWIFSGAILKMDKGVRPGDQVTVRDHEGNFLAIGHYSDSSIAIRVISFNEFTDKKQFWNNKILDAYQFRQSINLINNPSTNCYRLIHAEGDGLPGLIVDIYDKVAVVQCHTLGMLNNLNHIQDALLKVYDNALTAIYCKSVSNIRINDDRLDTYIHGDSNNCPALVKENDVLFEINWESGQKTGFFLDQRDNRRYLSELVKDKKVLNAFSYSGGFSIYALLAGAKEIHSVDISETASTLAHRNTDINGTFDNHKVITADVMDYLKNTEEHYDVMIVDPPAFAKSKNKRHNAVQAYKRLNLLALNKLNQGGILSTYSCSQVVDKQLFYNTIKSAAIEAGKSIRVLRHLSQPADHPVSIFHDEGSYLKGLVLHVI